VTDLETRDTTAEHAYAALGFTCEAAIRSGLLDPWLIEIWRAVRYRRMILDPDRKPTIPLPRGQVWIWLNRPDGNHWRVVGTGAVVPDEDELRRSLGRPTRTESTHA
jgi:hypothetical protein